MKKTVNFPTRSVPKAIAVPGSTGSLPLNNSKVKASSPLSEKKRRKHTLEKAVLGLLSKFDCWNHKNWDLFDVSLLFRRFLWISYYHAVLTLGFDNTQWNICSLSISKPCKLFILFYLFLLLNLKFTFHNPVYCNYLWIYQTSSTPYLEKMLIFFFIFYR